MLQAVPMNLPDEAQAMPVSDHEVLPLHRLDHARELLDDAMFDQLAGRDRGAIEYARFVRERTKELLPMEWRPHSARVARVLIEEANRYGMDPVFLMAVIRHESKFNPEVVGSHGEIGLMQIKPSTARWILSRRGAQAPTEARLRELLRDPVTNIRYGTAYLAHLRDTFKDRAHLYLSAYNMGPANVRQHLRENTQPRIYSDKVLSCYMDLATDFMVARSLVLSRRLATVN